LLASLLRERARLAYGSRTRASRGGAQAFSSEVRHALRRLLRAPAFTAATVLTLALAIGANSAIYAVTRGVLLAPLPYPESDRLVLLDHGSPSLGIQRGLGMTKNFFRYYLDRASTLEALEIHQTQRMSVSGDGDPEQANAILVTPSISTVLRVAPELGRWFAETEAEVDAPRVAVLSHGLWLRRFGADADVLGRDIVLNGVPHEIVGVMPEGFAFPESARPDVWLPLRLAGYTSGGFNFEGVARLRAGVALSDLTAEQDRLIAQMPEDPTLTSLIEVTEPFGSSMPLKESMVGSVEQTLWTLLGAAGIVFLIACANVANLFLVRTEARQRELAVRRALGASRRAIPLVLLTEAGLLALAGGVVGLSLATLSVRAVVSHGPQNLPRLGEVGVGPQVAAFALGLSLLSALVFGSVPFARRTSLATSLHERRAARLSPSRALRSE
jgi:predicted permease